MAISIYQNKICKTIVLITKSPIKAICLNKIIAAIPMFELSLPQRGNLLVEKINAIKWHLFCRLILDFNLHQRGNLFDSMNL